MHFSPSKKLLLVSLELGAIFPGLRNVSQLRMEVCISTAGTGTYQCRLNGDEYSLITQPDQYFSLKQQKLLQLHCCEQYFFFP